MLQRSSVPCRRRWAHLLSKRVLQARAALQSLRLPISSQICRPSRSCNLSFSSQQHRARSQKSSASKAAIQLSVVVRAHWCCSFDPKLLLASFLISSRCSSCHQCCKQTITDLSKIARPKLWLPGQKQVFHSSPENKAPQVK